VPEGWEGKQAAAGNGDSGPLDEDTVNWLPGPGGDAIAAVQSLEKKGWFGARDFSSSVRWYVVAGLFQTACC
jgi:hypothetical protein